jgi:hypothetical protein
VLFVSFVVKAFLPPATLKNAKSAKKHAKIIFCPQGNNPAFLRALRVLRGEQNRMRKVNNGMQADARALNAPNVQNG